MPRTSPVVANANFWRQVDRSADCWLWTGSRSPSGGRYGTGGYGKFSGAPAHRIAYESMVGPIPPGMQLDHLCKTPPCVNPAHLEPVTPQENVSRHLGPVTSCKRGHPYTAETMRLRMREGRRNPERVCRRCDVERHAEARQKRSGAA